MGITILTDFSGLQQSEDLRVTGNVGTLSAEMLLQWQLFDKPHLQRSLLTELLPCS